MKGLIEKRNDLMKKVEELNTLVDTEQRSYSEDEQSELRSAMDEIEKLDAAIALQEETRSRLTSKAPVETPVETRSYSAVINDFVRCTPAAEYRAGETTLANNSATKVQDFSDDIIKKVNELCGIAEEVSTVVTAGTYKQIVQNDSYKVHGGWVEEATEFGTSESRWTTQNIDKYKYGSISVFTLEMLYEAAFDVVPELIDQFSLDFAYGTENGIIAGTGSTNGQPDGLISGGTVQTVANIKADTLIDTFHSLKAPYYQNAKWLMNNATLATIRKLKDSTGQYLFHQNELTSGYVGTLFGKPVLISECMPAIGSGNSPILFGDFKKGYKAVRNPAISLTILNEKYAHLGARGVQGILWLGGAPVNSEAYTRVTIGVGE